MPNDNGKLGKTFTVITAVFLVNLVGDFIVLGATASIPLFTGGSLHALFLLSLASSVLLLMSLFVVHLVFLIVLPHQKLAHLVMLVLIPATIIMTLALLHDWEQSGHRRWFFQTALPEYQATVKKILRDPTVLKDRDRLQVLVGYPPGCSYISGKTRSDGSVVIYFSGADHWREGYVYYSGGQMSGETNRYLTNGWFEF